MRRKEAKIALSAPEKAQRALGREIKARAESISPTVRIPAWAWRKAFDEFEARGYARGTIKQACTLGRRRVDQIYRETTSGGATIVPSEPILTHDLSLTPESFKAFYEKYNPQGYSLPEHCREWIQDFFDPLVYDLMLNVPSRHNKSSIFSHWVPVFLLAYNRDLKILVGSETERQAVKWSRAIAFTLTENKALIADFGPFKPENQSLPWSPESGRLMVQGRAKLDGDMSIQVKGAGAAVLGAEANVIIVDDPQSPKSSSSEETTKRLDWLREEMFSRATPCEDFPTGKTLVIGQRVRHDDIYSRITEIASDTTLAEGEANWTIIKYPAVLDWPSQKVLWPDVRPWSYLMAQRRRMGKLAFEALFQQNPAASDAPLVDSAWWARNHSLDLSYGEGPRLRGDLTYARVTSLDPAPTGRNALVTLDILYDRETFEAWVVDYETWRGQDRLEAAVFETVQRLGPDYFVFEKSATSGYMTGLPWMERLRKSIPVLAHGTSTNKNDLLMGMGSVAADIEAGRLHLPWSTEEDRAKSQALQDEIQGWYPEKKSDYDLLAAIWFVKWNHAKLRPPGSVPRRFNIDVSNTRVPQSFRRAARRRMTPKEIETEWRKNRARTLRLPA